MFDSLDQISSNRFLEDGPPDYISVFIYIGNLIDALRNLVVVFEYASRLDLITSTDEMTKKRKKKSKNWASKEEDAEAKPFGVEEPVHNNEKSLDRRESPIKSKNPPQNTAPVAFSKQKKRKREEVTTIPSPHGDQLDNVPTKKKKGKEKKKKKKKMRQRTNEKGSKTRKDGNSSDVEGLNTSDSSVTLEGCLVDDVLVLIDRSKGIVYSATDVSENGNRKEVGKLDNDGGVVFFQKPKGELGNNLSSTHLKEKHACIEAGSDVFSPIVLVRSNIVPEY